MDQAIFESRNRNWIPEFGVIHGYDDEDRVFYLLDGKSSESQVALYDNLGLNVTEFWYCRAIEGKVEIERAEIGVYSIAMQPIP